jgi:carbonic anhydrase
LSSLPDLLSNNRRWSEGVRRRDPGFFDRLARIQAPRYLWIGCSDSRVPANEIVGLMPGELFVHRNVANVVVHSDLNCLAVLQYAVEVLRVEHVIVCGHYGCGGVEAAWKRTPMGLIDNWLSHVQDVAQRHHGQFTRTMTDAQSADRLGELNVLDQVANVCRTSVAREAWRKGQSLAVHGWIYRLQDGLLHDLGLSVARESALPEEYGRAVAALGARDVARR